MIDAVHVYEAIVGTGVGSLVVAGLEKKFQFIKPAIKFLEDHKAVLAEGAAAVEAGASELLHSPKLAELELKINHTETELADAKLTKLAGQVLHAAGKRLDSLTANQKTGYALVISTEAKKLGLNVSQAQIEQAMTAADKAVDTIASLPLFQSTQAIDASTPETDASAPAQPAQAAQA